MPEDRDVIPKHGPSCFSSASAFHIGRQKGVSSSLDSEFKYQWRAYLWLQLSWFSLDCSSGKQEKNPCKNIKTKKVFSYFACYFY